MNNTTHMGNGEMETLIQKLDNVIDPSIFLSVRTPAQWRTIVSEYRDTKVPHCPQPIFLSSLASRLGLYNDGMLGSANDTGTYGASALNLTGLQFVSKNPEDGSSVVWTERQAVCIAQRTNHDSPAFGRIPRAGDGYRDSCARNFEFII